jgi:hypothetical protein
MRTCWLNLTSIAGDQPLGEQSMGKRRGIGPGLPGRHGGNYVLVGRAVWRVKAEVGVEVEW